MGSPIVRPNRLVASLLVAALPVAAQQPNWGLEPRQLEALRSWLTCAECDEQDIAALKLAGSALTEPFRSALSAGLSDSLQQIQREELRKIYREAKAYGERKGKPPFRTSEREYVEQYLHNLKVLYRVQAARGIAIVGGPRAADILRDALDVNDMENEVKAVIDEILETL